MRLQGKLAMWGFLGRARIVAAGETIQRTWGDWNETRRKQAARSKKEKTSPYVELSRQEANTGLCGKKCVLDALTTRERRWGINKKNRIICRKETRTVWLKKRPFLRPAPRKN